LVSSFLQFLSVNRGIKEYSQGGSMSELAIAWLLIPVLWALIRWRTALVLCLVTAILQDPLRKLTPEKPAFFIAFVGVVFGAACLAALLRGVRLTPSSIIGWRRHLTLPFSLFVGLLIIGAGNAFLRAENPLIPVVGLLSYLAPFPAIVFAYQLGLRDGELRINEFMKWYIVLITLALTTVYFEFVGYNWPVLGQVGPTFLVWDETTGMQIVSAAGIFRASEVAAWHAMAAACFIVMMILLPKVNITRVLIAGIGVALLMSLGTLTGRRKIVVEVAVFLAAYGILWLVFEKRMNKVGIACLCAAVAGYTWLAAELRDRVPEQITGESLNYSFYVQRTQSGFENAPTRFVELGIAPIMWAYDRFGLFGAGLGVGTQAALHLKGAGGGIGAAEGGFGKIMVELGIPGLFIMGWFGASLLRHLWGIMGAAFQASARMGRFSCGLFSFLLANLAGFSVATQVYGDVFILLTLGWILGTLLVLPAWLKRQVHEPLGVVQKRVLLRPRAASGVCNHL
jgi:hypothetical protein